MWTTLGQTKKKSAVPTKSILIVTFINTRRRVRWLRLFSIHSILIYKKSCDFRMC